VKPLAMGRCLETLILEEVNGVQTHVSGVKTLVLKISTTLTTGQPKYPQT